jgi:hypothetical protein
VHHKTVNWVPARMTSRSQVHKANAMPMAVRLLAALENSLYGTAALKQAAEWCHPSEPSDT